MGAFYSSQAAGFPEDLLNEYRPLSCLKANETAAVFLAEAVAGGRRVAISVTEDADRAEQQGNEAQLLRLIADSGAPEARTFPRLIDCRAAGSRRVLIREWIPGESVEAIVEAQPSRPGMPRADAVRCALGVLRLLAFLHRLDPPVIHRDVKPQNVVIDPEGGCHLIDLGISRRHSGSGETDTRVMGTRMTAPPEQFGYAETDERSDIYSTGVLLRYCLSGEYDESADAGLDPDLRRVVEKATRFDPRRRYQSAEAMHAALLRAEALRKGRMRRLLPGLAALALLLAAGLFAARLLGAPGRFDVRGVYHFREPLLERAVRGALGIEERGLTADDLARVTALSVFGRWTEADESAFQFLGAYTLPWREDAVDAGWRENGGIRSLEDVRALPNLVSLSLYRQEISDISPLAGTSLERLGLGFNPLTDLTPLAGQAQLRSLNLCAAPVASTEVLQTLTGLEALDLSGTALRDARGLEALPLRRLNLVNVALDDYAPLAEFGGLRVLALNKLPENALKSLRDCGLTELALTGEESLPLEALAALPTLERLEYRAATPMDAPARIDLPALRSLDVRNVRFDSLCCLSGLERLEYLNIAECACTAYDGLAALPSLRTVACTAAQAAALEALYPARAWAIAAE